MVVAYTRNGVHQYVAHCVHIRCNTEAKLIARARSRLYQLLFQTYMYRYCWDRDTVDSDKAKEVEARKGGFSLECIIQ